MLTFKYKARDKKGTLQEGLIKAASEEQANKALSDSGYTATSMTVEEKTDLVSSIMINAKIPLRDVMIFSKELAVMVNAGLPIVKCLETLASECENKRFKKIIDHITTDVEGGENLYIALEKHPQAFSAVFVNAVRAGEASGKLDEILLELSVQLDKDYETITKIKNAMYYPAFVVCLLIFVTIIMLVKVVPQIQIIFEESGATLPVPTLIILWLSKAIRTFGIFILIGLIFAFFLGRSYIGTLEGRKKWDNFKIKVPLFGILFKKLYMYRITGILGTLIGGGLPILESLDIASKAVDNEIYKIEIQKAMVKVKDGIPLSNPLKQSSLFPRMVPQMVKVGEETGQLDEMLKKMSQFYHNEVDVTVRGISSLIEPILILFIGVGVGVLVAAVIMPIYSLSQVL